VAALARPSTAFRQHRLLAATTSSRSMPTAATRSAEAWTAGLRSA